MNFIKRKSALLLSAAMFAGMLTGCGANTTTEPAEEKTATNAAEGAQISMVLKTTSNEYSQLMIAGAEKACKDYNVKIDIKGATSETAYDEQQNMIETDLSSGKYDAMIIAPLQGDMVKTMVAGTDMPIFAIDTDFEADEKISFIGIGQAEAAASGGEAAVEMAKEAGWDEIKCAYIAGVQGDSTAEGRKVGYQQGIEAAGGTYLVDEIQYADAVADKAVNCMEAIMQNHPEGIAIICCHNDDCAIAAARAAETNPAYKNTIFVGFDGNITAAESILEGGETLTVAQSGYDQGYKAVETVVKNLNGEKVDEFIDCGVQVIGKDSAEDYLTELKGLLGNSADEQ